MTLNETGLPKLWDRIRGYVAAYVHAYDELSVATVHERGQVRPDGDTIVVDGDGVISVAKVGETDPTVPAWAKESTKPTYTAAEVGALPDTTVIPTKTSELDNDSGFLDEVPTATASTLGLVRPDGTTITISDGVLSTSGGGMRYRGAVNYQINLPTRDNVTGDLYTVRYSTDDLMNDVLLMWDGSGWVTVKADATPRVSTLDSTDYSDVHEFAVMASDYAYHALSLGSLADGMLGTHQNSGLLTDAKTVVGAINELHGRDVDVDLTGYATVEDVDALADENASLRAQVASLRKRINALVEIVDPDGLSADFVDGDVTIDGAGADFSDGDVTIDSASADFADGDVDI